MRDETEWVETVNYGWNSLAGTNEATILNAFENCKQGTSFDDYGDGTTSSRVLNALGV